MNFKRCKVCQPRKCRQIIDQQVVDIPSIVTAPDCRSLHPVRAMLRSVFLIEIFSVHAVRGALHGHWTSREMREKYRRNARIKVDHLSLCEAGTADQILSRFDKFNRFPSTSNNLSLTQSVLLSKPLHPLLIRNRIPPLSLPNVSKLPRVGSIVAGLR